MAHEKLLMGGATGILKKGNSMSIDLEPIIVDQEPPKLAVNYHLSEEELKSIERGVVADLVSDGGPEALYAVWTGPSHPLSNVIRTLELGHWETMDEIMAEHEGRSQFLSLVDTRGGRNQIVHGFRLSQADPAIHERAEQGTLENTGIVIVDDIIHSGQNFSAPEFYDYYVSRGYDPAKFLSVETNFRIAKTPKHNGLPPAQIGYLAVFNNAERSITREGESAIFAGLNRPATVSLGAVGVEYGPIADRNDLRTPLTEGEFDDNYTTVAIPGSAHNLALFRDLQPFGAPTVYLDEII